MKKTGGLMKQTPKINSTYITSRLASCLEEVGHCRVTTVVAPMGYGKSTAVRWWMGKYSDRYPGTVFLWQTLSGEETDIFWRGFCRILRRQFPEISGQMEALGYPGDRKSLLLLAELLEDGLGEDGPLLFYILDDVHYFGMTEHSELLTHLLLHLPRRVRLILISRNRIFRESDRFRLGSNLCQITMEELRLRREEIVEYAGLCGLKVDSVQAKELDRISEGWISLLYLLFRSYARQERWHYQTPDIFCLMDQVMYQPLDERKKRFLLVNSLSDAFTSEQAAFLWQEADAGELLRVLTQENAFISFDGVNGTYSYHNMLRNVVHSHFQKLPGEEQQELRSRLGQWQMEREDFLQAMVTFHRCGDWERLLDALVLDRSKSLGGEHAAMLEEWSVQCPEELLLRRPDALLVLMLNLYTYYNIPEMMRIYGLFQRSMEQDQSLSPEEKNNLLGESEIILSFLDFNDINAMSVHHRRACCLMNRYSYSMGNKSPWTFGCPSILMTYHRAVGAMDRENSYMRQCIPFYTRVTEDHGIGADHVMEGEIFLVRGETRRVEAAYYQAVHDAAPKGQYSILLTAAFLLSRLALLEGRGDEVIAALDRLETPLKENCQYVLLPTLDLCRGWIYVLLGKQEEAAEWLMNEDAESSFLAPAAPMFHILVNQMFLARGDYSKVVARQEELQGMCEQFHYLLCEIYLWLQTAAALFHLNRTGEGASCLKRALDMALPDRILLPFVEIDDCLIRHLEERKMVSDSEREKILRLAECFRQGRSSALRMLWKKPEEMISGKNSLLSRREREIARMAAERKSNQEIAETLFLSERTVKNHLNRVYDKMGIPGNDRSKRIRLAELLEDDL